MADSFRTTRLALVPRLFEAVSKTTRWTRLYIRPITWITKSSGSRAIQFRSQGTTKRRFSMNPSREISTAANHAETSFEIDQAVQSGLQIASYKFTFKRSALRRKSASEIGAPKRRAAIELREGAMSLHSPAATASSKLFFSFVLLVGV